MQIPGLEPESDKPGPGFATWITDYLGDHLNTVEAKAKAYGSNSLAEMGHMFTRAQGRTVADFVALEIGCYLYAYGKMQRVADAMIRGEQPGEDSWHDVLIYTAMALYIRDQKRWP